MREAACRQPRIAHVQRWRWRQSCLCVTARKLGCAAGIDASECKWPGVAAAAVKGPQAQSLFCGCKDHCVFHLQFKCLGLMHMLLLQLARA